MIEVSSLEYQTMDEDPKPRNPKHHTPLLEAFRIYFNRHNFSFIIGSGLYKNICCALNKSMILHYSQVQSKPSPVALNDSANPTQYTAIKV